MATPSSRISQRVRRVRSGVSARIPRFAAIDFETADQGRDSACAVSVVVVDDGAIAETVTHLIRPPRKHIVFDYIHGITWRDVCDKPVFGELWPDIRRSMEGVSFIAAHNASFDKSVLGACCSASGHRAPAEGFLCTVKVAREVWGIYPTKLPDVCQRLRIPLKHHDAASDARACAQIVLAAAKKGFDVLSLVQKTATAQRGN